MFTQLNGRKLWFDGSLTVEPENLVKRLELGLSVKGVYVEEMTPAIEQFNRLVSKKDRITVQTNPQIRHDFGWNIPDSYKTLDVFEHVMMKFYELAKKEKLSKKEMTSRLERIEEELNLYLTYNLLDVLSVMVYIIDTFKANNVVWGVGRGSSVSSYVLYVLEVHDIDSVKFNLSIEDFLKPNKYKDENTTEV
jgi:DNA polymerase III alpha subunit